MKLTLKTADHTPTYYLSHSGPLARRTEVHTDAHTHNTTTTTATTTTTTTLKTTIS